MNRINRKVEYGLIALRYMSAKTPGSRSTAREIADSVGCSQDVLGQVMNKLAQAGIVDSEQGLHGGYWIVKDLSRVSLYDLMSELLGPMGLAKCMNESSEGGCELRANCNIVSPMQTLNKKLIRFYRDLSLVELLDTRRVLE